MTGTFVTSTPRDRIHPLAYQGILVTECHSQITSFISSRLDSRHTLLFAEPVLDTARNSIDWYYTAQGQAQPVSSLAPEQRQAVMDEIALMGENLAALATSLQQADDTHKSMIGHILALALNYPGNDENLLYVVGDQPVLVGWGFGPALAGAKPENISMLRAVAQSPPVIEPQAAVPLAATPVESTEVTGRRFGFGWLWWLLPLLLLLLLLALLMTSFGGRSPLVSIPGFSFGWPSLCFMPPDVKGLQLDLDKALALENELTLELDGLHNDLLNKAALCMPEPQPVETEQPLVTEPEEPQQNELILPEENTDLSFLEGVWRCETGLVSLTTGAPVVVEYVFDATGQGSISIDGEKGLCRASVTSTIVDGKVLRIVSDEEIPCPQGAAYLGQQIECSSVGGEAQCFGQNLSQGSPSWDATFQRVQ